MSDITTAPSILVNGEIEPLAATSLAVLLVQKITGSQRGLAVALNGTVVPRASWPATPLRAGDRVEIVRVRQGG